MKKMMLGVLLLSIFTISCSPKPQGIEPTSTNEVLETSDDYEVKEIISSNDTLVNETSAESTTEAEELTEVDAMSKDIDLSDYFGSTEGGAIFLSSNNQEYVYNQELVDTRNAPNSTFKIVSTLMGLEQKIVVSEGSKMNYDGTIYWHDPWNANLNLKEAFQNSCVWYYHQLVYQIPQNIIQNQLNELEYGNCDISQWEGNGSNAQKDLNGFWLNSSLKISPREQVYLLERIFEKNTIYSMEQIQLLKNVMSTQTQGLSGKTGSGNNQSWYVGFFELENEVVYFATFIQGEGVSGALAKEISIDVFNDWEFVVRS